MRMFLVVLVIVAGGCAMAPVRRSETLSRISSCCARASFRVEDRPMQATIVVRDDMLESGQLWEVAHSVLDSSSPEPRCYLTQWNSVCIMDLRHGEDFYIYRHDTDGSTRFFPGQADVDTREGRTLYVATPSHGGTNPTLVMLPRRF